MALVTAKAHSNQSAPGTATWTVTVPGTPAVGDLILIAISSDASANTITGVTGLTASNILINGADGTGSAHLVIGTYSGSNPVITISVGANHAKLACVVFDQTVYSAFGTLGTQFNRSSSQTTTTAPSTGSSAAPNLCIWWDKTTSQSSCSTGITDIENVLPNSGIAGSVCVSTYDDAAGVTNQTATYGIGSGNGKGVQLPLVLVTVTNQPVTNTGTGTPSIANAPSMPAAVGVSGTSSQTVQAGSNLAQPVTNMGTGSVGVASTEAQSQSVTIAGTSAPAVSTGPVAAWLKTSPLYVAHFGGDADWPPGLTLHNYTLAALWNKDLAFEVDVWPTTDGVWVVSHDNTTDTLFGTSGNVITSSSWASISSLTTTVGGYPIMRLETLLNAFPNRAMMIDNKGQLSMTALLNLLDTYGGSSNFMTKGFCTSTGWADAGTARGYQGWGYYYDADIPTNLPATASHWSMFGMDVVGTSTSADWTALKSYGKKVLAHIVATPAQKSTGTSLGADGFMASGVQEVVPQTPLALAIAGVGSQSIASSVKQITGVSASGSSSQTLAVSERFALSLGNTGAGTPSITVTPKVANALSVTGAGTPTVTSVESMGVSISASGLGTPSVLAGSNANQPVTNVGSGAVSLSEAMKVAIFTSINGAGSATVASIVHESIGVINPGAGSISLGLLTSWSTSVAVVSSGAVTVLAHPSGGTRNITFRGRLLERRWDGRLLDRRWSGRVTSRRWKGRLL